MPISKQSILIANFGGPRSLDEIASFLRALLTDKDVVRTKLPQPLHNILFSKIAKRRSLKIRDDYASIGGKSPIFDDTEYVAEALKAISNTPTYTFHRYLPHTHQTFAKSLPDGEIIVFPMFPQFTYATTGSIARFFAKNLPPHTVKRLKWVPSYATHKAYIDAFVSRITHYLFENELFEESTYFLFSAHGIPKSFVDKGDIYQSACEDTYRAIMTSFPKAESLLCYQSKFGPGEWLRPYTSDIIESLKTDKTVVFIPLSFTSDHIETLFEVEEEYMAPLKERGLKVMRCPALGRSQQWIEAIHQIVKEGPFLSNNMLIR